MADGTGATGPDGFTQALAGLQLFEQTYEGLEILAALPNEDADENGNPVDTVQVTYRIIGRPGSYTVSVPFADNWNAIAFFQIGLQANTIELIYEGASSLNDVPTVYLTETPTTPTVTNTYYKWQTIDGVHQLVPVVGEPIPTPGNPVYQ